MKKLSIKFIAMLICVLAVFSSLSASKAYADDDPFTIDVTIDKVAKSGETFNLICSIKGISYDPGLCGIGFDLTYDKDALTPVIVSSIVTDTTPYDAFMTTVPQYIVAAGDSEVSAPAYENISRHFDEGKYTLNFIDKLAYPGQKEGTTVDSVLKDDGDLTLSIPFKVNENISDGYNAEFKFSSINGTTAGEIIKNLRSTDFSITVTIGEVYGATTSTTETTSVVTDSNGSVVTSSPDTASQTGESISIGSETKTDSSDSPAPSATNNKQSDDDTSSTTTIVILTVCVLAVTIVAVFLAKKKSNESTQKKDEK